MKLLAKMCRDSLVCPAIYKSETKSYIIIGKKINEAGYPELKDKIGMDETAIEIPEELLEKLR